MKEILIWVAVWYLIWGIYNAYLRWVWEGLRDLKYVPRGIYFFIAFIVIFVIYYNNLYVYSGLLFISLILTNVLGLLLSTTKVYYDNFKKDRFFILFQSFNILYQQTSLIALMLILKKYLGENYKDIYFGVTFFLIHTPLLFLPWAKLKYYIVIGCFFGGWLFSYLNFNYVYGLIYSFLIHYLVYVWEMYYLKDEEKI
jgi:hypothetical protein